MKRPANAGKQQQPITALLGERIKKSRPPPLSRDEHPAKRQKLDNVCPAPAPAATPQPPSSTDVVTQTKKKWRLADIIQRERQARLAKEAAVPAFSFRPVNSTRVTASPSPSAALPPVDPSTVPVSQPSASNAGRASSQSLPGGEAILYDRSMLPISHGLLLDVLTALESALPLLRTRQVPPTVAAVRDIVEKSTRRNFTLRTLSQLAHVVPECVAVVQTSERLLSGKRMADILSIRLDAPEEMKKGISAGAETNGVSGKNVLRKSNGATESVTRVRRALLHERLIQHVRKQHDMWLSKNNIAKYSGVSWHPDFDLDVDVKALPSPALYSAKRVVRPTTSLEKIDKVFEKPAEKPIEQRSEDAVEKVEKKGEGLKLEKVGVEIDSSTKSTTVSEEATEENTNESADDGENANELVPQSLLQRVRAREKTREMHAMKAEVEVVSNRGLLEKLPTTMDSIYSVLRAERRSAMGWGLLIGKVVRMHPKKWPKEDIQRQMEALVKVGSEWCSKVQLKSSRGGFAFRVVNDGAFHRARTTVCETESLDMGDDGRGE